MLIYLGEYLTKNPDDDDDDAKRIISIQKSGRYRYTFKVMVLNILREN